MEASPDWPRPAAGARIACTIFELLPTVEGGQFDDALETNDSAVKVLGDEALRTIARELVATVRANVTIDWTVRENVRAQLRVLVKRILRKYGYPPDKQEKATETVLEHAALFSESWAGPAAA
jgi:type I restriction enzyme, R subunit